MLSIFIKKKFIIQTHKASYHIKQVKNKNVAASISTKFLSVKLEIFSCPSVLTYVLGAHKNCLIETVLLSTHNVCFGFEIRNLVFCYTHS